MQKHYRFQIKSRKEVIYLVDICLVAVIGFVLFVLTILDLIDELKR